MKVRFEGHIPKTLREWVLKHAVHKVYEVCACPGESYMYDAALRAGWSKCDDAVHTLVGDTARDLIAEIRDASPCDCEQCTTDLSLKEF